MMDVESSSAESKVRLDDHAWPVVAPSLGTAKANKLVGFDTRNKHARAFTLLRTRLKKELASAGHRLLGITSPTPSSGKSFFALNIAASLAKVEERQVYLVDLDLRRGSVADNLGLPVEKGVDDFLSSKVVSLAEIGIRIQGTDLIVVPTKPVSESSAELLASDPFELLISHFRELSSGLVIFDLPPAFAGDDAMLSVQRLDCYAMVVESGRTTRRQLQDAMRMLEPTPCIGTILNRYRGGLLDSYGYGIGGNMYEKYYS